MNIFVCVYSVSFSCRSDLEDRSKRSEMTPLIVPQWYTSVLSVCKKLETDEAKEEDSLDGTTVRYGYNRLSGRPVATPYRPQNSSIDYLGIARRAKARMTTLERAAAKRREQKQERLAKNRQTSSPASSYLPLTQLSKEKRDLLLTRFMETYEIYIFWSDDSIHYY